MLALSISNPQVVEADGAQAVFELSGASFSETSTVQYTTENITAQASQDYLHTFGTLTFHPSDSINYVTVPIVNDTSAEPSETFRLVLSTPSPPFTLPPPGTATIVDNEPSVITITNVTVTEGHNLNFTNAVFQVRLEGGNPSINVSYATENIEAIAGSDYHATSGNLSFDQSNLTRHITVRVVGDTTIEDNETFRVRLQTGFSSPIGIGTILDDDTRRIFISNVSVSEGNSGTTNAVFSVTLDAVASQTVSVQYTTNPGSATAGVDYTSTSGVLTFSIGQTSKSVTVSAIGDTTIEGDEQFHVDLFNPIGAQWGVSRGIGTIRNDDLPPTIHVSVVDATVLEGDIANVPVTLSAPSSSTITVSVATGNAPPPNATANVDYLPRPATTLTFSPFTTVVNFTVQTISDSFVEPDERFAVNLVSTSGATPLDNQGLVTILERPTMSINSATVTEPPVAGRWRNAVFAVSLSFAPNSQVKVNYNTLSNTAVSPQDFASTSGTLTFNPGVALNHICAR